MYNINMYLTLNCCNHVDIDQCVNNLGLIKEECFKLEYSVRNLVLFSLFFCVFGVLMLAINLLIKSGLGIQASTKTAYFMKILILLIFIGVFPILFILLSKLFGYIPLNIQVYLHVLLFSICFSLFCTIVGMLIWYL